MTLAADVRAFLLSAPLIARLGTIDANGYPHVVPLWYDLDGDDVVIITDRDSHKVRHIARNPNGSVQVGGDETPAGGPGYLFKGELSVEDDPGHRWLEQVTLRYESPEDAARDIETWRTTMDMCIIRLRIARTIKVM